MALTLPLAGVGSRFLALAMDTAIQIASIVALTLAGFAVLFLTNRHPTLSTSTQWTVALSGIATFLVHFGYFATFEALWQGQTPGKRNQDLRVIKDNGASITVFDAIARNLARIVDGIPGIYAIGVVSVFASRRNKRLGDFLAGTIVVYDKPIDRKSSLAFRTVESSVASPLRRLTPEQFQLLETYTARKYDFEWDMRNRFAAEIIDRLAASLEIGAPQFTEEERRDPDALIERLVNEYRNR